MTDTPKRKRKVWTLGSCSEFGVLNILISIGWWETDRQFKEAGQLVAHILKLPNPLPSKKHRIVGAGMSVRYQDRWQSSFFSPSSASCPSVSTE